MDKPEQAGCTPSSEATNEQQELLPSFQGRSLLPPPHSLPLLARYSDQIPAQIIALCLPEISLQFQMDVATFFTSLF